MVNYKNFHRSFLGPQLQSRLILQSCKKRFNILGYGALHVGRARPGGKALKVHAEVVPPSSPVRFKTGRPTDRYKDSEAAKLSME